MTILTQFITVVLACGALLCFAAIIVVMRKRDEPDFEPIENERPDESVWGDYVAWEDRDEAR